MTKNYARPLAVLAIVIGMGTGGCQTMSDLDPTGLLSEDAAPESQFPTESPQQAEADAATTTPDLAGIPTRPAAPSAAAQADAAQQVAAAGAQAQYSADALRAGTDAAAAPPTATDTVAARQALASAVAPPAANDAPPSTGSAPAAPAASGAVPTPPVPAASVPVVESPAARSTALAPPGAEPAVPAVPATAGARRMAAVNPSDAELGFKPSSAPPLNPAVAQWVAPPIMAHYRQTAAAAGSAGTGIPAVPAVAAGRTSLSNPSGDVVANLDAVPGTPTGMAAAMNGGVPPAAIVYFPGDTTSLSTAARTKVRDAVAAFRATGGAGTVKVVGHASSRTPNMPVERHLEVIFQKSQARANAVAQALIRAGIPAEQVRIEAVGDSQPVFYESMPKGEDGNRRAEIFILG
ncbi:MAG TPA: OmpA family protein [Rhizomicrobium sp.]|nr:OmpA family protein [Rhizomicrobium sp.]